MKLFKQTIPQLICSVAAVTLILGGYLKVPALKTAGNQLTAWITLITPFAMIMGAIMVTRTKIVSIIKGRDTVGRFLDVWQLAIMVFIISLGMVGGITHPQYVWVFDKIVKVLSGATTGLIVLLTLSSAWRVLKVKNWESSLFIAGLFLTMLALVPLGEVIWSGYPKIAAFVQDVLSMATMRALAISMVVGMVATGLRTILGIEKGHLGRD